MLHGAGAAGQQGIDLVEGEAEARGGLVLAPDSRGRSWDLVGAGLGPDVAFLDRALAQVFGRYAVDPAHVGRPRVFVSHGTKDAVLPIDRCSRSLVPELERDGYVVRYHEFDGGHWPPPGDVHESFAWWLAGPLPPPP